MAIVLGDPPEDAAGAMKEQESWGITIGGAEPAPVPPASVTPSVAEQAAPTPVPMDALLKKEPLAVPAVAPPPVEITKINVLISHTRTDDAQWKPFAPQYQAVDATRWVVEIDMPTRYIIDDTPDEYGVVTYIFSPEGTAFLYASLAQISHQAAKLTNK